MQKGRGKIDLWYTVLLISANGITREFEFTNFCVFEDYSIWLSAKFAICRHNISRKSANPTSFRSGYQKKYQLFEKKLLCVLSWGHKGWTVKVWIKSVRWIRLGSRPYFLLARSFRADERRELLQLENAQIRKNHDFGHPYLQAPARPASGECRKVFRSFLCGPKQLLIGAFFGNIFFANK